MNFLSFVIVTGLSGAGKSQAMKSFEDLGFYCLDNLPPKLIRPLVRLCHDAGIERLALALDVRTHGPFGDALAALGELLSDHVTFELLFLDAGDAALVRRYSETRRRHPFGGDGLLGEAIMRERQALAPLRTQANRIWDTSHDTHATLKARIVAAYATSHTDNILAVNIVAFGFKYGLPIEADLVLDVRFLPNPNYVPELKALTGSDEPVRAFMRGLPATAAFLTHFEALVDFLIPQYIDEGKTRLTIAVGCTGGRHRSVYIAEALAAHLAPHEKLAATVEYRELTHA